MNEIEVPLIETHKIIDTSCAGDAFCGKKKPIELTLFFKIHLQFLFF